MLGKKRRARSCQGRAKGSSAPSGAVSIACTGHHRTIIDRRHAAPCMSLALFGSSYTARLVLAPVLERCYVASSLLSSLHDVVLCALYIHSHWVRGWGVTVQVLSPPSMCRMHANASLCPPHCGLVDSLHAVGRGPWAAPGHMSVSTRAQPPPSCSSLARGFANLVLHLPSRAIQIAAAGLFCSQQPGNQRQSSSWNSWKPQRWITQPVPACFGRAGSATNPR